MCPPTVWWTPSWLAISLRARRCWPDAYTRSSRLEAAVQFALCHGLLHHPFRKVVPHRVRRRAHSLKRNIARATANGLTDSPMSMTQPKTTLTRGQYAPLPYRSSAAPLPTLPQRDGIEFLITTLTRRSSGPTPAARRWLRPLNLFARSPNSPPASRDALQMRRSLGRNGAARSCSQCIVWQSACLWSFGP